MNKKFQLIFSVALVITFLITACAQAPTATPVPTNASGQGETASEPFRVGLIVATGGLGDRSFNDSGYAGVEQA